MSPTVTLVLVTYNSADQLAACLTALRAVQYDPPPRLVVVDNASDDASIALVRRFAPAALVLPQPTNLGFGPAVNLGVMAAPSELVALLNPDTVVHPNWLAPLVAAAAAPTCGIAGSKILAHDGQTLLHAGGTVDPHTLLTEHRGAGERDHGQYDQAVDLPFVTGASLVLRRAVWAQLGGFDVGFFPAYVEDLDLCWRAQHHGLTCRYVPQSVLRHTESPSTGKFSGSYYYYAHRNRFRFACKHLPWATLWGDFCVAEAERLTRAAPLDRAVATLVYRDGLPHGLVPPTPPEQATILALGRRLATIPARDQAEPTRWPHDLQLLLGRDPLRAAQFATLRAAAEQAALLQEHTFTSPLPLIAQLRRLWNSIATRWYVLPLIHQQTRENLATTRSLTLLSEMIDADPRLLLLLVRQAVLAYRLGEPGN